jgi:uncharacterized membrane protein
MKTRLLNIWESVRTSFWFLPSIMVSLAIGFAFMMVATDKKVELESDRYWFLYQGSAEGVRTILSTIAGSMMTVAGVTFSITIVTLTLTSSQYGPRLLRNFMRDTGNQFVIGTFISTFIYCLLVLLLADVLEKETFIPSVAVSFAVLLALLNVGVLIYFIHHVAASIQADMVIEAVYRDLMAHIEKLLPEKSAAEKRGDDEIQEMPRNGGEIHPHEHSVAALRSGYLQAIDYAGLIELSQENDLLVCTHFRPGKYVFTGNVLATVKAFETVSESLCHKIAASFLLGSQRTPEQDIEFAINQLVEIAVRALSPGINDPHTAMTCIDRLGSALCCLTARKFPSPYLYDDENRLRVISRSLKFSGVVEEAFNQIRQYGRSSVAVSIRLLEILKEILSLTRDPDQQHAILRQGDMIARASFESIFDENDRKDIEQRYRALRELPGRGSG